MYGSMPALGSTEMKYILYNAKAKNGSGKEKAEEYLAQEGENTKLVDLENLDKKEWIKTVAVGDIIILCGGDGTLNRFVNDLDGVQLPCPVLHYRGGTGNDFLVDIEEEMGTTDIGAINKYIEELPTVKVKDIECKFVNGIGFGIDGMCCEYADKMRAKGKTDINYTTLAIRLCLFHYKAPNAKVFVDGKELEFKKVWLAASMNGRYYGGGMKIAPNQKRNSGRLCLMVVHNVGRLKLLTIFPKIFTGGHMKHTKQVSEYYGNHIKVVFDQPMALQIDGETVLDVTEYEVNL